MRSLRISLLALFLTTLSSTAFGQYTYTLNQPLNVKLPPLVYMGPQYATLDVLDIPRNGIQTVNGTTTVSLDLTDGRRVSLKFIPWSPGFFMFPRMTNNCSDMMETVLRETLLNSRNYSVVINSVWTWPQYYRDTYYATLSTTIDITNNSITQWNAVDSLVSGHFHDNPYDPDDPETQLWWGTLTLREWDNGVASDYDVFLLREDENFTGCGLLNALPLGNNSFGLIDLLQETIGGGAISIQDDCDDIVHSQTWWWN